MRSSSVIELDEPVRALQRVENRARPRPIVTRPRLDSIDLLRGLIMVLMLLDHTRDFFGSSAMNPRDVNDPALFLTRWVTHFCAPLFIFLAGLSAFLYGARGRTRQELSLFLLTRGAWLVLLELSVVLFGWTFNPAFNFFVLQVIWAIGWSMIALAGLIYLPRVALVAFALSVIAGHTLLDDGIRAEQLHGFAPLWLLLHEPGSLQLAPGIKVLAVYPLVPWIAVMAAGYAFGPVMNFPERQRRRWLIGTGVSLVGVFVVLRALNVYGDPVAWQPSASWSASVLSFINCEKYPPSLLYLAMTLGSGLIALALFENARGRLASWLITFGAVPFFYYIVHIYLIHVVAIAAAAFAGADLAWLFQDPIGTKPNGYGVSLPLIYVLWFAFLLALYPLCRWFAALKQRRHDWWLSYL
jgi:uncharacterized membrane protein